MFFCIFQYELHSGKAPFESYDPTGTAKKILKGRPSFPSSFSPQIQSIIKELLTKDPTRRLGCMSEATMGVIQHRFYNGFDWKGLLNKRIPPPYTPRLPKNGFDNIGYKDDGKSDAKDCKCKSMPCQLSITVVSFSSYLTCTLTHMFFPVTNTNRDTRS